MKSFYKKTLKKVWRIIIITVIVYILFSFAITKIVYDAIFARYDEETTVSINELSDLISDRQEVEFRSEDNLLKGYFYGTGTSDGIVVVAPGYHAGADDYLWQINSFLEYGWDVFAFDCTGHCESEGNSSVGFPQEILDLDAALNYVENNYQYPNVFLFGHSRGGYAACNMVGSAHSITAVVSVSGINSAMEAIMEPAASRVGFIAYGNYHFLWLYQTMIFGHEIVNLSVDEELNDSTVPTLIIQGENDDVAPKDSSSIYSHKEEISSECVEYYICDTPGQDGHTNLLFDADGTANDVLMNIINQFYSKKSAVSN